MSLFQNTIYVIRHGESESNTKEILSSSDESANGFPLTEAGIDEVCKAAEQLRDKSIDRIVSSPLLRTKQTAEILGDALGAPVEFDSRFTEIDMGEFDGKPYEQYHEFFRTHNHSFDVPIPGGESWRQVADRMKNALLEFDAKHPDETILVVSHEDPLALLDWTLRFTDPKDFDNAKFLKTGEWYRFE